MQPVQLILLAIILLSVFSTDLYFSQHSHILEVYCPILIFLLMFSKHIHYYLFFFNFLPQVAVLVSACVSHDDIVEPNDIVKPNISDLLVSHYDCSKQQNLSQFSLYVFNPALKLLRL